MFTHASFFRFHTYEYARNFVSACTSLLGLEGCFEGIKFEGKFVKVDAVRMGTSNLLFYLICNFQNDYQCC